MIMNILKSSNIIILNISNCYSNILRTCYYIEIINQNNIIYYTIMSFLRIYQSLIMHIITIKHTILVTDE